MTETNVQVINGEIADERPLTSHAPELAVRHVLERQLSAGQDLSNQLVLVATDVTASLVEAPGKVVDAIRTGATLPAAVTQTGDAVGAAVTDAGARLRAAIGNYAMGQAPLPHAVVTGLSELASTLVRAQGGVLGVALDGAWTVATAATRDEDVRDTFDREWQQLAATVHAARGDISDALADAANGVRVAVSEGETEA